MIAYRPLQRILHKAWLLTSGSPAVQLLVRQAYAAGYTDADNGYDAQLAEDDAAWAQVEG